MRVLKLTSALGAFFVLAIALSACGSSVGGESVATMAGNPVSRQAFNHWIYVAAKGNAAQSPGAPVIVPNDPPDFKSCIAQVRKQIPSLAKTADKQLKSDCNQLFGSLGSQVMDFLIRAYWYQAEAAKLHITVSDSQVQTAFQQAKKQQFPTDAQFNQFLQQSGQTLKDILFRVRINQLLKKLLARQSTTVTPAQIQAYYAAHTSEFSTQQTRDVRIVRTKTAADANAAKSALQSGKSWQAVAQKYSIDTSTKSKGGLLSGIAKGQEESALDTAAFSSPVNKIVGPVHGSFGYYVVEVINIRPASKQTLAQATPVIKQLLQSQTSQNTQAALDAQVRKDWLPKTTCRGAYAMADCKGYKAPKTPASGIAGAASGAAGSAGAAGASGAGAGGAAGAATPTP